MKFKIKVHSCGFVIIYLSKWKSRITWLVLYGEEAGIQSRFALCSILGGGLVNSLSLNYIDYLCHSYFCISHIFHHPNSREIKCSNVLACLLFVVWCTWRWTKRILQTIIQKYSSLRSPQVILVVQFCILVSFMFVCGFLSVWVIDS